MHIIKSNTCTEVWLESRKFNPERRNSKFVRLSWGPNRCITTLSGIISTNSSVGRKTDLGADGNGFDSCREDVFFLEVCEDGVQTDEQQRCQVSSAPIAQFGGRKLRDLNVMGSIPTVDMMFPPSFKTCFFLDKEGTFCHNSAVVSVAIDGSVPSFLPSEMFMKPSLLVSEIHTVRKMTLSNLYNSNAHNAVTHEKIPC